MIFIDGRKPSHRHVDAAYFLVIVRDCDDGRWQGWMVTMDNDGDGRG